MDNLYPQKYFNDENIKHEASFDDLSIPFYLYEVTLKLPYRNLWQKIICIRLILILVQEALILRARNYDG